ncbi:MAG: thioesterase domain-containing protein, partial [Blastocatellia bacterium]
DAGGPLEWQPLIRMHRGEEGAPLFLLPGAGGNIIYLYGLARRLGQHRLVFGLQSLGLDGLTKQLPSIQEIARFNIEKIFEGGFAGPYVLAGHSFGAKVAFEMSQQLLHSSTEVALVIIFDTPAPVFEPVVDRQDWNDAQWLFQMTREIEEYLGVDLEITCSQLSSLSPEDQLDLVAAALQRTGWWAEGWDRSQLQAYLRVFRTNVQIDSRFRVDPGRDLLPVRLVLFKAREGHHAPDNPELAALFKQETWGWDRLSPYPVQVFEVPGDHLTMMSDHNVETLAEEVRACLTAVQTS